MLENIILSSVSRRDFLKIAATSYVFGCGEKRITNTKSSNNNNQESNNPSNDPYSIFDYLPLEEGNEWTYAIESRSVIKSENERTLKILSIEEGEDKKTVRMNGFFSETEIYYIKDGTIFLYSDEGDDGYLDPPIIKGNSDMWFHEHITTNFDYYLYSRIGGWRDMGDGINVTTLLSLEDVKTPAGKFKDCLKIQDSLRSKFILSEGYSETTTWFAKGIGKVKVAHAIPEVVPERGGYIEFILKHYRI